MTAGISLPCDSAPGDHVNFTVDTGHIVLACAEQDTRAAVFLTETTARELFNWLGVVLHTDTGLRP